MATTYTWDLQQIELISKGDFSQVVHRCFWKCTAMADSGATKEQFGVVDLDVSNLNSETFKSFNSLAKEEIVAWVKSVVSVASVENGLHPESTSHSYVETALPKVEVESTSTNA